MLNSLLYNLTIITRIANTVFKNFSLELDRRLEMFKSVKRFLVMLTQVTDNVIY